MAKVAKSKVSRPNASGITTKPKKQLNKQAAKLKAVAAPPLKEVKKAVEVAPEASVARQKIAQKLAESLEKRKLEKGTKPGNNKSFFGRPPGRRGRRPKQAAEYTPMQQEEDSYVLESEYERLEYDTGIRLKDGSDDGAFSFDRVEDFDEELNFDP